MRITAKNIDTLPPGVHRAGDNLYLRVFRTARNPVWLFVYYLNAKRFEMSLGSHPNVSIAEAKARAARCAALVADGIDPKIKRASTVAAAAEKRAEEARKADTFSILLEDALPTILTAKQCRNEKHVAQWGSTLRTYALPILGSRSIEDIGREDILEVLRPIWFEKNETASRVRGRLEAVFNYAIATGRRKGLNPCTWKGNLDMFLPPPSKVAVVEHQEALTLDESRALVARLKEQKKLSTAERSVLFGMLTAARVGEFIPAKWSEIDLSAAVWLCPPERRKDGKPYPHRVPLSTQALDLLKSAPHDSEYIFPSTRGNGHISKESPRAVIRRLAGRGTMHGFRSTFRDWAAETGQDQVLAEKSLMHATGNAVVQAYQRSDLLEQRRPLIQAWADALFEE